MQWHWVRGHRAVVEHEAADALAKAGADGWLAVWQLSLCFSVYLRRILGSSKQTLIVCSLKLSEMVTAVGDRERHHVGCGRPGQDVPTNRGGTG